MDTFYEIKPGLLKRATLALGFFDGVHPGHEVVIRTAVEQARAVGAIPAVVTFREHPRSLTLGKSPPLLTLIEQRLELFEAVGIEAALVLSFTEELCRLNPEDYVKTVLVECMGAKSLSVGFNHRFGRNRVGDPELLRELGKKYDYTVHVAGEVIIDGSPVSSSRIRECIQTGDVSAARHLLSRPYAIQGMVEHGEGRGHELGFPTANLHIPVEQVMPAIGVYACYARLPDNSRLPSVVNIGKRPTFGEDKPVTTEVHLLDYDGNLYGRDIQLEFMTYVRPEKKFASVDELKQQIAADCNQARDFFKANPAESLKKVERLTAEQH